MLLAGATATRSKIRAASERTTHCALRHAPVTRAGLPGVPSPELAAKRLSPLLAKAGYDLVRLVATGGMGAIYEVRDHATGRRAACKLASACDEPRIDLEQRLQLEAELLRRMHHPRIVQFRATGQLSDGRRFLVMEWLAGPTLGRLLTTQRHLALGTVARWMDELLDGLAEVHRHGFVHGDVKPDNLLVGPEGGLRLIDFGAAVAMERSPARRPHRSRGALQPLMGRGAGLLRGEASGVVDPAETSPQPSWLPGTDDDHLILGTPRYLAPERREGLTPDARCDLFAVGILLRELLTTWTRLWPLGQSFEPSCPRPVNGVLVGLPAPLERLRVELGAVACRASTRRWAGRYADARGMQRALCNALEHAAHHVGRSGNERQ